MHSHGNAGTVPDFARQTTRLCPAIYPTLPSKLPHFAQQSTSLCWAIYSTLPGNLQHFAGQLQMRGQSPQIMRQFAPPWRTSQFQERREMKTQRKDQTEEQYVMRAFALMVHRRRTIRNPEASLRATAKDVWRMHPEGYANFANFYRVVARLAQKYVYSA